jgi:DNA ligase (NAD+)
MSAEAIETLPIEELRAVLDAAQDAYDRNAPIMSDGEFERLAQQFLDRTEQKYQKLGAPTEGLRRVTHQIRMLSIDKMKHSKPEKFGAFMKRAIAASQTGEDLRLGLTGTAKVDGMAIDLIYEDGQLVQAATRGDGVTGDDVTHNLRHVQGFPQTLGFGGLTQVRAEVAMTWESVEFLNQEILDAGGEEEDLWANPRNAAAGILRRLEPSPKELAHLKVVAYRLISYGGHNMHSHDQEIKYLEAMGFETPMFMTFPFDELAGLDGPELIAKLSPFRAYYLPTDGVILRVNDNALFAAMGEDAENILGAIAFKFPDTIVKTILRDIEWRPGRSNVLAPRGLFDEVQLEGTKVRYSTLCNLRRVNLFRLAPGVEIGVRKANMIIPETLAILNNRLIYENVAEGVVRYHDTDEAVPKLLLPMALVVDYPRECPACGHPTTATRVHLLCLNPLCKPKLASLLKHLAARERLDISGLGGEVAAALVESGVQNPYQIWGLDEEAWSGLKLASGKTLGTKTAQKIRKALEKAKAKPFVTAFKALGCPGLGVPEIKSLESKGLGLRALIEMACQSPEAAAQTLMGLPFIGPVTARALVEWLIGQREWLWYMPEHLNLLPAPPDESPKPLTGLVVVITGEFPELGERDGENGLKARLERLGARVTGSVSRKTTHVCVGAGGFGTVKHSEAMAINQDAETSGKPKVKILVEYGLRQLLEGALPTESQAFMPE